VDAAQPQVEREIALDLVRHGLMVAPVVVLVAGLIRGLDGAASAAIALGIVFLNFLFAAITVGWARKTGRPTFSPPGPRLRFCGP
jgi:hypothetical protein